MQLPDQRRDELMRIERTTAAMSAEVDGRDFRPRRANGVVAGRSNLRARARRSAVASTWPSVETAVTASQLPGGLSGSLSPSFLVEQERHGPDAGARGLPRLGLAFPWRRSSLPFRARFGSEGSARGRVDALVAIVPADAVARRGIATQHFLNDARAGSAVR
jgi:hypothetical protein